MRWLSMLLVYTTFYQPKFTNCIHYSPPPATFVLRIMPELTSAECCFSARQHSQLLAGYWKMAGWRVVSVCVCVRSRPQRGALGQWNSRHRLLWGGVGTVYPAKSWAPRGRAHEFMLRALYAISRPYVCLSVCPSVTRVDQSKTVKIGIIHRVPKLATPLASNTLNSV